MDRRVKERLVGASILVVLLVLIVPELLSGPASPPAPPPMTTAFSFGTPEPGRTVTVDLATSKAPAQEGLVEAASAPRVQSAGEHTQASVAEPPVLPAATLPAATLPAATLPAATARHTAPLETPTPPPTSMPAGGKLAAHSWAVQLGSFASRDNANKLVRQLKGQGFSVYVSPTGSGAAERYRARIGPLSDYEAATQMVGKLKSLRQAASIVRPGA